MAGLTPKQEAERNSMNGQFKEVTQEGWLVLCALCVIVALLAS